jgi:flagellar hook-basal body complex protein FliE
MSLVSNLKSKTWWSGLGTVAWSRLKIAGIAIAILAVTVAIAYFEYRRKMVAKAKQQGQSEQQNAPPIDLTQFDQAGQTLQKTLQNLQMQQLSAKQQIQQVKQTPATNIQDAVNDWNKEVKADDQNQNTKQ